MKIPLFPLDLVLFPGVPLPLHIFEPRYRQMTAECLAANTPFGIVRARPEGLAVIGCTAQIVRVLHRYPDGRSDILTQGVERFEIEQLIDQGPMGQGGDTRAWLQAEVDLLPDTGDQAMRSARQECVALHFEALHLVGTGEAGMQFDLDLPVAYLVAASMPADLDFRRNCWPSVPTPRARRRCSAITVTSCPSCAASVRSSRALQAMGTSCNRAFLRPAPHRKLENSRVETAPRARRFPRMSQPMSSSRTAVLPTTLGQLRASKEFTEARVSRSVKDELRANLIRRLQDQASAKNSAPIFPGIIGFDDTVVPQIINAILSRQNFILLGLRGQAKSRILRALTELLDPVAPYVAGSEIRDNPYRPISKYARDLIAERGDATPIAWMTRDERYVEKLATPDVTVADLIGDVDPIKAARSGSDLSNELTMHYGLLAARQSRHLRGERAARPGRKDSGRALQHHAGRRCAD